MRADLLRPAVARMMSTGTPFARSPLSVRPGLTDHISTIFPGRWADVPAQMRARPADTFKLMETIPTSPLPFGTAVHDPRWSGDGHANVIFGQHMVDGPGRKLVTDLRSPLWGTFSAFPNGTIALTPELGTAFLAAPDKPAWLNENRRDVDAVQARAFDLDSPPTSFAGWFFALGNGSCVQLVQHEQRVLPDGSLLTLWHPQTTSWHVFDGAFAWAERFDPATGIRTMLGVQVGKHAWYDLDGLNVKGGGLLHWQCNSAGLYHLDARARGENVTPGDLGVVTDPKVYAYGLLLAGGDLVSPLAASMRENHWGSNTAVDRCTVNGEALERLVAGELEDWKTAGLPPAAAAGITVDGIAQTHVDAVFGPPIGPPGADRIPDLVTDLTRYTRSQQAWDRVRDDVLSIAAASLGADVGRRSRSELLSGLLNDPASAAAVRASVAAHLLDPVTDSLFDELATITTDPRTIEQFSNIANLSFHEQVTAPLLAPDGALRAAMDMQVLAAQVKVLDVEKVNAEWAEARTAAVQRAQDLAQLQAHQPQEPEAERAWEEAVTEAEAETAAADERADRLEEQHSDLTEFAERDRREQEHEQHSAGEMFPER
ncbi:hypothetical protein [Aquihabitans sp. McL0605]|uniref:hypothetical protein n=1 Tax=Aquihabitans sp. McL0605 TaxID=3415671 RepID=UPI003CF4389E